MAHTTEHSRENLERLLDLIADALILSQYIDTSDVEASQKFIRNGQLQQGAGAGLLALFQRDIKANEEDLSQTIIINEGQENEQTIPELQSIADGVDFDTLGILVELVDTGADEDVEPQTDVTDVQIFLQGGGDAYDGRDITDMVFNTTNNPLNISQFIPLKQEQSIVDVERAEEFLDTNIFELLPFGDSRQARINRFFQELNALLPPLPFPNFDADGDGNVDRDEETGEWIGAEQYSQDNSISYAQDNPDDTTIGEENAFIHRLKNTANDTNFTRTIQDIYNTVIPYLGDLLEGIIDTDLDDRTEYENQSSGYIKFRDLNQGIIIRNTNQEFIEGLDPNNPTWLTNNYPLPTGEIGPNNLINSHYYMNNQDGYLLQNAGTGFTITMWVKFLDKTSQGTLFNYGNPSRSESPFGFSLETYVVNREDETVQLNNRYDDEGNQISTNTFGGLVDTSNANGDNYLRDVLNLFQNTNSERFVRLKVREFGETGYSGTDYGLRSSEVGNPALPKYTWNAPDLDGNTNYGNLRLLNGTHIPEDFNEWYFICASYNPSIIEPTIFDSDTTDDFIPNADDYNVVNGYDLSPASSRDAGGEPLFWLNHIDPFNGTFVNNSGYGNKCKVEIISRTDLLRARGFKKP